MIAEKNVEENYHMAMEHMPEAFARCVQHGSVAGGRLRGCC
jgi:hypothetical protein